MGILGASDFKFETKFFKNQMADPKWGKISIKTGQKRKAPQ